jgi:hypothetical protein
VANYPIEIWFENTTDNFYVDTSGVSFSNNLTDAPLSSNMSCSYAGGCSFFVTKYGISTMLQAGKSKISVCDEVCEY